MFARHLAILAACLGAPLSAQTPFGARDSLDTVDRLRTHVFRLADDSMMGRVIGSAEYAEAAQYVAEQLQAAGVAPAFNETGGSAGGFFHTFETRAPWLRSGRITSYNVAGIIPGSDPTKRGQVVVLGAHLDHVAWPDPRSIYNGASDNASGVAVVLEVARLLALDPPSRLVLVVFFGGEEVGLVGSQAFVRLVSGDAIALNAIVNVDDVGHLANDPIGRPRVAVLSGGFQCVELIDRVRQIGDRVGVGVTDVDANDVFERSDHYSFVSAGIPALFVTSGQFYPEFHEPSDDPDRLDYDRLKQVTDLVYATVRAIAENAADCEFLRD